MSFSSSCALLSPSSAKCLIRALDIAVSAVSDPEKNAEVIINPRIDPMKIAIVVIIYLNPLERRNAFNLSSLIPSFIIAFPISLIKMKVLELSFLFLSKEKILIISSA